MPGPLHSCGSMPCSPGAVSAGQLSTGWLPRDVSRLLGGSAARGFQSGCRPTSISGSAPSEERDACFLSSSALFGEQDAGDAVAWHGHNLARGARAEQLAGPSTIDRLPHRVAPDPMPASAWRLVSSSGF